MSTTPRTDRQTGCAIPSTHGQSISAELLADPKGIFVHAVFARTLETELAAMTARAEKAEAELAVAKEERDLNRTRLASLFWSGALDNHTGGEVQKWAAEYTAELDRFRAEVGRLLIIEKQFKQSSMWDTLAIVQSRNNLQARVEKAEATIQKIKDVMREDSNGKDPMDAVEDLVTAAMKESIEVPDSVSIEARNPTGGVE